MNDLHTPAHKNPTEVNSPFLTASEYANLIYFCVEHDLICLEYHRRCGANPASEKRRFERIKAKRMKEAST